MPNMKTQENSNYSRIAAAINYIDINFKSQPTLEEIASAINLSAFHFQRLFTEWAGVSPKKFLQYLTLEYAKKKLRENNETVFKTAIDSGLSGTGRLHDLFVGIEGMTPGEYKNGGENLMICYSYSVTLLGNMLIASTDKGICYMAFANDKYIGLSLMYAKFPKAIYIENTTFLHQRALQLLNGNWTEENSVKLHLKGSQFQLKVWETLLKTPFGSVTTYGTVANTIRLSTACRAVGTAVGANPIAFLIPCHRIIKSTGALGQYHWGVQRKAAIIGWEAAQLENNNFKIDHNGFV
jgi:AraC family transcriptional regulator of adaptative response/methylated-DNA-[protein]-cysteine methyltransferase